ncbi:hypothetical protein [Acinetobacter sp. P1(2025)]|uniref:hypothetical protein n=1 Tax=Acinetobacter sp. P1(2025) TaxID=3446120 RepID=UPI003F52BDA1
MATGTHPHYHLSDLDDLDFDRKLFVDLENLLLSDNELAITSLPLWFSYLIQDNDAFLVMLNESINRDFIANFNKLAKTEIKYSPIIEKELPKIYQLIDKATGYNPNKSESKVTDDMCKQTIKNHTKQ